MWQDAGFVAHSVGLGRPDPPNAGHLESMHSYYCSNKRLDRKGTTFEPAVNLCARIRMRYTRGVPGAFGVRCYR